MGTITLGERKGQTTVRRTLGGSETRTRCFRRLHLLQASVTRCFLGAVDAGGPISLLVVEAASAESWPIRCVDRGESGASFPSSDAGLWLPDRESL